MFILSKFTPPPPTLNNLFKYLILLSITTLPAHAKVIHRQAYKVCQAHEEAYWDGSKGVCCDGNVYQKDENKYACCPTGKEVSIVQGKENLNHCCSEGQKAYWDGSAAQCCATATHQIVTNYISGQTDTAYACCEVKEDYETEGPGPYGLVRTTTSNWTIAGATNGYCCSGYTSSQSTGPLNGVETLLSKTTNTISILHNGGLYFCAPGHISTRLNADGSTFTKGEWYESGSRWCEQSGDLVYCYCSEIGDPIYSEDECEPTSAKDPLF